jgi:hypothetical protein
VVCLETDAQGDWDVVAIHAVLRENVKTIQVCISEGESPRRVEGVDETRFGIQLGSRKVTDLVGHSDASINTEGVAGITIEVLVGLKLKAITKKVAFLTNCRSRKRRCLVIETGACDDVSSLVIGLVEVVNRIKREGPYMAVAADLGQRISVLVREEQRRPVVDSQKSVEGRGLDAEVVPVKLSDDTEFLIEVATDASLNVVTGGERFARVAGGHGEAATDEEGVFRRAVGVGVAVVVVGTAVAAARRRLIFSGSDVEVLNAGKLGAAGAAGVLEVVRSGKIDRCSEAGFEADGRHRLSRAGRLLSLQAKRASGEKNDCRSVANDRVEAIFADRRVHLFVAPWCCEVLQ